MDKSNTDPFWGVDPSILMNIDRAQEFFPSSKLTNEEKYNAISRFLIYLSMLLFTFFGNANYFWIAIIGLISIWIYYYYFFQHSKHENFDPGKKKLLSTTDLQNQSCQKPTPENPLMNVLLTDYIENPNRYPSCPNSDPQIIKGIEDNFNINLYKDVEDLWNNTNSQRQFYTTAVTTIPNDRESFMKWCWGSVNVSKQN